LRTRNCSLFLNQQLRVLETFDLHTESSRQNATICNACNFGRKTGMTILVYKCNHQFKQCVLHTSEKVARCGTLQMSVICNSAYIPPMAQTLYNMPFLTFTISVVIRALSSCWVFTLCCIYLVFHTAPKKNVQRG
jgi:hypothetical protein